jgi:hypothetical protein
MSLSKNKKGGEGIEAMFVNIGLLLIAVVVIFIFILITGTIVNFFSKDPGQGTQESFNLLVSKISQLKNGEIGEHAYYIEDNFYLFGFVDMSEDVRRIKADKSIDVVSKPDKCSPGTSCLCLCNGKHCDKEVVECNEIKNGEKIEGLGVDSLIVIDDPDRKFNRGKEIEEIHVSTPGNYFILFGKWGAGLDIGFIEAGIHHWKPGKLICYKKDDSTLKIRVNPEGVCEDLNWQ